MRLSSPRRFSRDHFIFIVGVLCADLFSSVLHADLFSSVLHADLFSSVLHADLFSSAKNQMIC